MMNDAEEVELLYRCVDHDQDLLQKLWSTIRQDCIALPTQAHRVFFLAQTPAPEWKRNLIDLRIIMIRACDWEAK